LHSGSGKKRSNSLHEKALELFADKIWKQRNEVLAIMVYGSVARGDAGPKSDIDVFVLADVPTASAVRRVESEINSIARDVSALFMHNESGAQVRIEALVSTPKLAANEPVWRNVLREGRIVRARGPLIIPELKKPANGFSIYSIETSGMNKSERSKVSLYLHGRTSSYRTAAGGRVKKEYAGILKGTGGQAMGRGVFIIPSGNESAFEDFLAANRVPYGKKDVILLSSS